MMSYALGVIESFSENVTNVLFSFFFVGTVSWNYWTPEFLGNGELCFGGDREFL